MKIEKTVRKMMGIRIKHGRIKINFRRMRLKGLDSGMKIFS